MARFKFPSGWLPLPLDRLAGPGKGWCLVRTLLRALEA